jgi:hypothetical protein
MPDLLINAGADQSFVCTYWQDEAGGLPVNLTGFVVSVVSDGEPTGIVCVVTDAVLGKFTMSLSAAVSALITRRERFRFQLSGGASVIPPSEWFWMAPAAGQGVVSVNQQVTTINGGAVVASAVPGATVSIARVGLQGPPGSGGGGGGFLSQQFTPTDGQNTFALAQTPAVAANVRIIINGIEYAPPNISVSGVTVTWAQSFTINATDEIWITY